MTPHPDELINKTLHALRNVEPSSTLESRILANLETRAASASTPTATAWFVWPLLASAVLVAAFLTLHHAAPLDTVAPSSSNANLGPATAAAIPSSVPRNAAPLPRSFVHPTGNSAASRTPLSPPSNEAPPHVSAPSRDPEAQLALAETLAPSQLAPPTPLTSQERLLLRASGTGELSQLAELDPSLEARLRSALDSRQKTTVERYIERMLAPLAASESLTPTPPADSSGEPPSQAATSSAATDPNRP